ncbi:MAG: hypothetical protein DRI90_01320 [Deltaproteobacteria bacterium]|nr:MAG: hypothetical protein DRI90_01320 [Deltaproteobacteria bacterium]
MAMEHPLWRTSTALGLGTLLWLGASACGGDDDGSGGSAGSGGGTGGDGGSGGSGGSVVAPHCAALVAGMNTAFLVDGTERAFILDLPTEVETAGPWPVVFNWHGLGDTAQNMSSLIAGLVNDPSFPFIGVTPEDAEHAIAGQSFDWDVFSVEAATNTEARLFDEIMICLDQRWGVAADHVHSVGFSLGGIATDMLGVTRGDQFASTASYSGAYFSNSANTATLGMLSSFVSWPAPTHGNSYAQMVMHGGTIDTFAMGPVTVHFDEYAVNDQAYLNGMGHAVVLCDHGGGHTAPAAGMMPVQVFEFFRGRPRGTASSPYAGGLPSDFSSSCTFYGGS